MDRHKILSVNAHIPFPKNKFSTKLTQIIISEITMGLESTFLYHFKIALKMPNMNRFLVIKEANKLHLTLQKTNP